MKPMIAETYDFLTTRFRVFIPDHAYSIILSNIENGCCKAWCSKIRYHEDSRLSAVHGGRFDLFCGSKIHVLNKKNIISGLRIYLRQHGDDLILTIKHGKLFVDPQKLTPVVCERIMHYALFGIGTASKNQIA